MRLLACHHRPCGDESRSRSFQPVESQSGRCKGSESPRRWAPLLPAEPEARAECLILEAWADETFMALTRRLAYWNITASPHALGELFFPRAPEQVRRVASRVGTFMLRRHFRMSKKQNAFDEREAVRAAKLATTRLGRADRLVDDRTTIADVALASMSAPLQFAAPTVRDHPAVQKLLAWGRRVLEINREFAAADSGRAQPA